MSLLPNTVINGNCLEVMKEIDDASIDMILCDLPYGATQNSWDSVIPPAPLWEQYERIIKPNGAILLFGQDKFTATMMLSNPKLHRYNIIWDKVLKTGHYPPSCFNRLTTNFISNKENHGFPLDKLGGRDYTMYIATK